MLKWKMTDDPSLRGQEKEETEMVGEQEVVPTDPPDQT
jgi:hypothetical protein